LILDNHEVKEYLPLNEVLRSSACQQGRGDSVKSRGDGEEGSRGGNWWGIKTRRKDTEESVLLDRPEFNQTMSLHKSFRSSSSEQRDPSTSDSILLFDDEVTLPMVDTPGGIRNMYVPQSPCCYHLVLKI